MGIARSDAIEVAVIIGGFLLLFKVVRGPLRTHDEIKPTIEQFSAGEAKTIDLRSGTEINRIILPPSGPAIVERIIINNWGEQEVRIISESK